MSDRVGVVRLEDEPAAGPPLLRGWFHLAAAVAAVAGTVWLLLLADSATSYVGAAVFGASLIILYWTSASYHTISWSPSLRRVVKRLDHAVIFVLIAGTYTPFCLSVNLAWGIPLLAVVWSLAGVGALAVVVWPDAPRWLSVALYLGLGWVGVAGASEAVEAFSTATLVLLAVGGVLYTIGAIVYAARRPDPWPRVFGYHEVFHALVVGGSAVHFALIAAFVLPS